MTKSIINGLLISFMIILLLGISAPGYAFDYSPLSVKDDVDYDQLLQALEQKDGFSGQPEVHYLDLPQITLQNLSEQNFEIVGYANLDTNYILKNKNKDKMSRDSDYIVYYVKPGDSLYKIAQKFEITVAEIRGNNDLKSDVLYIGQKLLIPVRSDNSDEKPGDNIVYNVKPGDSLYTIALEFKTTIAEIKRENDLESDILYVGQRLFIPVNDNSGDSGGDGQPENPGGDNVYYVKAGDSLYKIAQKFGITVLELKAKNNLESNNLYIGQKLLIPSEDSQPPQEPDTPGPDTPGGERVYYVQAGDSLYKIALKFGVTVEEIRLKNNLESDILRIGQKLIIPETENPDIVLKYRVEPGDNIYTIARKFNISFQQIVANNNLQSANLSVGQEINIPFYVPSNKMNSKLVVTDQELKLLARAVYSEARGEPFMGQIAVASVIINRIRHPFFPDTIKDVIFQPWQFSAVHDGQFWLEPNQSAYIAARAALEGWDPTGGAIYYYNPDTATSNWVFYRNVIVKIGNHYFAV